MIYNIISIIFIIILIFFFSNETKINDLISKKYIKYLFLLLIIFFIYQNYNLSIFLIFILIIILLNVNIQEKIMNNSYFKNNEYFKNFEYFKNIIKDYLNNNDLNESFSSINKKKENIEPFNADIIKIKDLYENIKLQFSKLS